MSTYPGTPPDDDPFAKRPPAGGTEETGPLGGSAPPPAPESPPPPPQAPAPEATNPWSGYGVPAGYGPPPEQPGQQPGQQHGQQPGQPGQQPAYGAPVGGYGYVAPPNHPQATNALVLGLVSLIGGFLCCLPLVVAPAAWVIGGRARREIRQSGGQLGGDGTATAGWVMGIIGTVLLVLAVLAVIGLVVVLTVGGFSEGGGSGFNT